jgi:hypothetical protein
MGKRTEVVTMNLSKHEKQLVKEATKITGKRYPATLAKEIFLKEVREIIKKKS